MLRMPMTGIIKEGRGENLIFLNIWGKLGSATYAVEWSFSLFHPVSYVLLNNVPFYTLAYVCVLSSAQQSVCVPQPIHMQSISWPTHIHKYCTCWTGEVFVFVCFVHLQTLRYFHISLCLTANVDGAALDGA